MKWVSVRTAGVARYGLLTDTGVAPVGALFAARYPDLKSVLVAGVVEDAAVAARANPQLLEPGSFTFDPVIPSPGKIICVGVNYLGHIREMGREKPSHPTLFIRFADTVVGSGEALVAPRLSEQYDYEGELAVVIGRSARHLSRDQALTCVAGWSCFMDGSVRDFQNHTTQFTAGKNFPRSGAFGPCLVTIDELPDPSKLELETRLNDQVMQQAPVSDLCFDVPSLVSYLSGAMQLEPGDVIITGTPSGVGFARKPPVFLKPGDQLEVEISGIGVLRNHVVAE